MGSAGLDNKDNIYGLALCAGIGGMELGLQRAIGNKYRTICYVEKDKFCQKLLLSKMRTRELSEGFLWEDIKSFNGTEWYKKIDILSAGFPCQPFSNASRGRKTAEDLWPEILRITKEVQPKFGFFENVQENPIRRAAFDLETIGYKSIYMQLRASEMGAPFVRNRWWLLAYFDSDSKSIVPFNDETQRVSAFEKTNYWKNLPCKILGVGNELSNKLDRRKRLKSLGNSVVPIVVANAFRILLNYLH